ncbi:MAG: flagella basal body P-ring formation protein FlgA [Terriglobales bacterium]
MKWLVRVMVIASGIFAAGSVPCAAEPVCTEVTVEARVEAGSGRLTLADLLAPGACLQLRQAAMQVILGTAPQPGSARVLDGRRVRLLLEGLASRTEQNVKAARLQIPERIVIKREETTKSCSQIAGFLAAATSTGDRAAIPHRWQENLDCAGARGIPQTAPLELTRTTWNAALQRWDFALRCARPEDCVPFLVWVRQEETTSSIQDAGGRVGGGRDATLPAASSIRTEPGASTPGSLVKPGQTAMLTWEQAGIRVVLPVTCLDAGGLGQFVRVRFKNAAGTLRAEVVGEGSLRASL